MPASTVNIQDAMDRVRPRGAARRRHYHGGSLGSRRRHHRSRRRGLCWFGLRRFGLRGACGLGGGLRRGPAASRASRGLRRLGRRFLVCARLIGGLGHPAPPHLHVLSVTAMPPCGHPTAVGGRSLPFMGWCSVVVFVRPPVAMVGGNPRLGLVDGRLSRLADPGAGRHHHQRPAVDDMTRALERLEHCGTGGQARGHASDEV